MVAFKHKKKLFLLLLLGIMLVCMAFMYRPLLTWYANLFSVHNAAPKADALVVLGGRIETRFPHAIKLFQQGYADTILLTDTRPYNSGIPDTDCSQKKIAFVHRDYFESDAPVFVVPSRSGFGCVSTFDEAWDLLAYSRREGYARIIIVTDESHTRRALYAFKKVFQDSGIIVEAMGAPNDVFNTRNWWRSDVGLKSYLLESLLLVVYFFTSSNVEFIENH